MAVRDLQLRSRLSNNIHLSRDLICSHFRSLSIRKTAIVNVLWFSSDRLNSQSKSVG